MRQVLRTHASSTTVVSRRHRSRSLIVTGVTVLGLVLAPIGVAHADPETSTDPAAELTTSADAKQAWLDAAQRAEAVNEQVLQAKIAQQDAVKVAKTAAATMTTKRAEAADAAAGVVTADAAVASYQERIDDFTNASFRGARLSQVSVLLTADSADEFLDSASALDRVAADTQQTLDEALAARTAATAARAKATAASQAADAAKRDADAAKASADAKLTDVKTKQADLTVQVAEYKKLYDQLTEKERQEAIEAAERARAEEAARQQAAAEEAERLAAEQAAAQAAAEQAAAPAEQAAPAEPAAPVAEPTADEAARADRGEARTTPEEPAPTTTEAPAPAAPSSQAQIAVQAALSKVGSSYVYGAAGPNAFDCSGLTSWAWAQAGVSIPHSSGAQSGYAYVPLDQLQPGDLVTYYSPVSHVALYIGNGQVVHASTESRPVYVTDMYSAGPSPSGHRVLG